LEKILASQVFSRSERMKRFLRVVSEAAFDSSHAPLKEYAVAVQVFGKKEGFDTRTDPIVRVEARRLRDKLREYYSTEGADDPIEVSLGKIGYIAKFALRSPVPGRQLVSAAPETPFEERQPESAVLASIHSVAVLPFVDMSPDKDQGYFCDGITEELIHALTSVPELRVVSRSSSFLFKGEAQNIRHVGDELGADAVIEGSVRRVENRIRITAQLTNTTDGFHLWSETYDEQVEEVFEVQERIAAAIVDTLKVQRAGAVSQHLTRRYTQNARAYQANLRGLYHRNKSNPEDLRAAIRCFEDAIAADPNYAFAYGGLALCYCQLGWLEVLPASEVWSKAKASALKALELDASLSMAHVALGCALCAGDWNWTEGEKSFAHATELDSRDFSSRNWHAVLSLAPAGRLDEALEAIQLAALLGPHSLQAHNHVGLIHQYRGEVREAIRQHQWVLEQQPDFLPALWDLGRAYLAANAYELAAEALQRAYAASSGLTDIRAGLAYCLGRQGKREEALAIAAELIASSRESYLPSLSMARIYAGLEDTEQAFEWLNKAVEDRSTRLVELPVDPMFVALRADERFGVLLRTVCLRP
jgi:serine/threonine-protein kinase